MKLQNAKNMYIFSNSERGKYVRKIFGKVFRILTHLAYRANGYICDISDNNSQLKCVIADVTGNDVIHGVFTLERRYNYM